MPIFGAIVSLFSSIFGGITKLRTEQADVVKQSIGSVVDVIKTADTTNAQLAEAQARILAADSQSESWLTRNWRPLTLELFVAVFILHLLGFSPVNMTPEILEWMMGILQIGLVGYAGLRSGEKIVTTVLKQINIGRLAQALVDKKL